MRKVRIVELNFHSPDILCVTGRRLVTHPGIEREPSGKTTCARRDEEQRNEQGAKALLEHKRRCSFPVFGSSEPDEGDLRDDRWSVRADGALGDAGGVCNALSHPSSGRRVVLRVGWTSGVH